MAETTFEEFERLVDRYGEGLYRFAFFRTGSAADSADIVQGVLVRLWERRDEWSAIENPGSYLYRAVANACCDLHRRGKATKKVPLSLLSGHTAEGNAATEIEAREEFVRIASLLSSLPPEQAEVVRMRAVDGLPFAEIADIVGIPLATAKSRFRYGIAKLKAEIKKEL